MPRCAACGSKSVAYGTKSEGFSIGKAVAGTIFFGPVGAVAGAAGKKKGYYHCGACGADMGYPMLDLTEKDIDKALADPAKNEKMLTRYKQRYCNIEWQPTNAVEAKETPNDSGAAIIAKIDKRENKRASLREQALLLYKYCRENNITSFPANDEGYINQLFGKLAAYLKVSVGRSTEISKCDFENVCIFANAYGYIDCPGLKNREEKATAAVSQSVTDEANARIAFLVRAELSLIREAFNHSLSVDKGRLYPGRNYIKGVVTEAFGDKDTFTPEELQTAVGMILAEDGISSDMSIIEELSRDIAFSTGKLPNVIFDSDEEEDEEDDEEEEEEEDEEDDDEEYDFWEENRDYYIVEKKDGLLTLHTKAEKPEGNVFFKDSSYLALKNNSDDTSVRFDRTLLDEVLDNLNPDALFEKYASAFRGDKVMTSEEPNAALEDYFDICLGVLDVGGSYLAQGLCAEGILEKELRARMLYYTLAGGFRRNEVKQAREKALANNRDINAKIALLSAERTAKNEIYEEYKKKIFGEGARMKKEALARINEIDAEIAALRAKLQNV